MSKIRDIISSNGNLYCSIVVDRFFVDNDFIIDITIFNFCSFNGGHTAWCIYAVRVSNLTKELTEFIETIFFAIQFIWTGWVTGTKTIAFVFLQMTIQICLLTEATFAQMTSIWFLFVVNITDMPLQIARNAERTFAIFALVWLLTGVRAQMPGQICRPWKYFGAKFARITILNFPTVVVAVVQTRCKSSPSGH